MTEERNQENDLNKQKLGYQIPEAREIKLKIQSEPEPSGREFCDSRQPFYAQRDEPSEKEKDLKQADSDSSLKAEQQNQFDKKSWLMNSKGPAPDPGPPLSYGPGGTAVMPPAQSVAGLFATDRARVKWETTLIIAALMALAAMTAPIERLRLATLSTIASLTSGASDSYGYELLKIDWADSLARAGLPAQAESEYHKLVALLTDRYGARGQRVASAQLALANLMIDQKRYDEAVALIDSQLANLKAPDPTTPHALTEQLRALGCRLDDLNRKDTALLLYHAAIRFWSHGCPKTQISNVWGRIAEIYKTREDYPKANEAFRNAWDFSQRFGDAWFNVYRLRHIACTYCQMGKFKESIPYAERAVEMSKKLGNVYRGELANSYMALGWGLSETGQRDKAIAALQEALQDSQGLDAQNRQWTEQALARLQNQQNQGAAQKTHTGR